MSERGLRIQGMTVEEFIRVNNLDPDLITHRRIVASWVGDEITAEQYDAYLELEVQRQVYALTSLSLQEAGYVNEDDDLDDISETSPAHENALSRLLATVSRLLGKIH